MESLHYDKRKHGVVVRSSIHDLLRFSLQRLDRLEPAWPYLDIVAIDVITMSRVELCFGGLVVNMLQVSYSIIYVMYIL